MRLSATALVRDAYTALLAREPDPTGSDAYADFLKNSGNFPGLLADLASSDEHWQRLVVTRSASIVRELFRGLLFRDPEPEAVDRYTAMLSESQDLTPLLIDIGGSQEHWERMVNVRANSLLTSAYL